MTTTTLFFNASLLEDSLSRKVLALQHAKEIAAKSSEGKITWWKLDDALTQKSNFTEIPAAETIRECIDVDELIPISCSECGVVGFKLYKVTSTYESQQRALQDSWLHANETIAMSVTRAEFAELLRFEKLDESISRGAAATKRTKRKQQHHDDGRRRLD